MAWVMMSAGQTSGNNSGLDAKGCNGSLHEDVADHSRLLLTGGVQCGVDLPGHKDIPGLRWSCGSIWKNALSDCVRVSGGANLSLAFRRRAALRNTRLRRRAALAMGAPMSKVRRRRISRPQWGGAHRAAFRQYEFVLCVGVTVPHGLVVVVVDEARDERRTMAEPESVRIRDSALGCPTLASSTTAPEEDDCALLCTTLAPPLLPSPCAPPYWGSPDRDPPTKYRPQESWRRPYVACPQRTPSPT